MKHWRSGARWVAALAFALALGLWSGLVIAQAAAGTGVFPKVGEIEKQLKRGASTKADVRRILGVPNGTGGALLPGFGDRRNTLDAYKIWYYEDIELTAGTSDQDVARINMRQQILGVFFKGEVFYGYVWTSNVGPAEFRQ
ncbi:MAG TPA: hypothetical protein VLA41_08235 [Burkholderiales bacterium]|nr:hypothetical protein [Burkholderiales bacterium]